MSYCKHTDLNAQRTTSHRGAQWPWSFDPLAKRVSQRIGPAQGRQAPAVRVSPLTRTDTLQFRAAIGSKALSDLKRCFSEYGRKRKGNVF
jgi:hypothetical protein